MKHFLRYFGSSDLMDDGSNKDTDDDNDGTYNNYISIKSSESADY